VEESIVESEIVGQEGNIICRYCASGYNSDNRKPLVLACGHTFCKDCVQGHF